MSEKKIPCYICGSVEELHDPRTMRLKDCVFELAARVAKLENVARRFDGLVDAVTANVRREQEFAARLVKLDGISKSQARVVLQLIQGDVHRTLKKAMSNIEDAAPSEPAKAPPAKAPLSRDNLDPDGAYGSDEDFLSDFLKQQTALCEILRLESSSKSLFSSSFIRRTLVHVSKVADLESRVATAEKERYGWLSKFNKETDRRAAAVQAERARVNGWWRWWLEDSKAPNIDHRQRDAGIASGAPAPGVT